MCVYLVIYLLTDCTVTVFLNVVFGLFFTQANSFLLQSQYFSHQLSNEKNKKYQNTSC